MLLKKPFSLAKKGWYEGISTLGKIFSLGLVVIVISGCTDPITKKFERCTLFGACISIKFEADNAKQGERLVSIIEGDLGYLVSVLDSGEAKPLLRLNGLLRSGEWFTVNPSVFRLLKKSKEYYKTSRGYFNPARDGLLMDVWDVDNEKMSAPPEKQVYQAIARKSATMDDIEIEGFRVRSINTNVALEFGTLLHGYTVDLVYDFLKSENARNIRVEFGNTVRISSENNPVYIAKIKSLQKNIGTTSVAMKSDEALDVCRLDGDNFALGGPHYTTIFNPTTGKPADSTGAVIVVHRNAMAANAACRAIFVAGPEQWRTIADSMATIASLYLPAKGKLQMSMSMLQRIETDKQKNQATLRK